MGLDLDNVDGQTLLDENEKEGLLIPTIATRGELDEFEQHNIEQDSELNSNLLGSETENSCLIYVYPSRSSWHRNQPIVFLTAINLPCDSYQY